MSGSRHTFHATQRWNQSTQIESQQTENRYRSSTVLFVFIFNHTLLQQGSVFVHSASFRLDQRFRCSFILKAVWTQYNKAIFRRSSQKACAAQNSCHASYWIIRVAAHSLPKPKNTVNEPSLTLPTERVTTHGEKNNGLIMWRQSKKRHCNDVVNSINVNFVVQVHLFCFARERQLGAQIHYKLTRARANEKKKTLRQHYL